MTRPRYTPCPHVGCPELHDKRIGDCPAGHAKAKRKAAQQRTDSQRPTARQRGYGKAWERTRRAFLAAHPRCIDCGKPATAADHAPLSRRELIRQGVNNPDAWHYLQPRCLRCHSSKTAKHDGGFGNPRVIPSVENGQHGEPTAR